MTAAGRSRLRHLLFPFLITLAFAGVAVGLGIWQVQRLAWKTALLARIDAAEQAPAVPMDSPAQFTPAQFTKIAVSGVFRQVAPVFYGVEVRDTRAGSRIGARLIQPFDRPGATPILIDRGWAPTDRDPPPAPTTPVTVDGYIRTGDRAGWFSAADDLANRRFYTLDPGKMARALGVPDAVPFVLVALGAIDGASLPQPAIALPRPPNDHLVYAITWFSLAGILVVIFFIHARKVVRT